MKKPIVVVAVAIIAGALQSSVADRVAVFGSAPDFLIAATIAIGLVLDPALAAVFGFAAGMIHGSIVGLSLGGFITSRTLLGFGVSSLRMWVFQDNPVVLLAAALLGTIACEGIFFLIDPARSSANALAQLPMESVYNAILAVICYLLIRRTMEREKTPQAGGY